MIIKVDNKPILDITKTMVNVLRNETTDNDINEDIERRLAWIITNKYEQCFRRLQAEWLPKLSDRGIETIPTNKEKFAELVFSQPDYKNRTERENNPERENNNEELI